MRRCPFHRCKVEIDSDLFACARHWFSLTKSEQQRIAWAYREYKRQALSADELRAIQQAVLGDRGLA